ncbi:MAG: PHP domain-containing protein [Pedosphaera sp.]|nr:PHP domain-containing protein [Pedosphaera sp.]
MFADLHLHTRYSDGTFTPEELASRAQQQGLSAVALTDHDTFEGCDEMAEACRRRSMEFIPGAELTSELEGHELHILGYWMSAGYKPLTEALARAQRVRVDRISEMVARLNRRGVALRVESVFEVANCRSPGRPHVARALVLNGFCRDFDEAFEKYLKKGRPAWVPKAKMDARTGIQLIHGAGGVAVLAHPGLYRVDALIPRIAAEGLDGLECWHSKHSAEASEYFLQMADHLNLAPTGGSDCHGFAKNEPLIGRVKLPYARVETLRARRPILMS